jgi:flagellar biosynthetic protein FliR
MTLFGLGHWLDFLPALAAVSGRITGLVLASPVFASQSIPRRVKGLLTLALSLMMLPLVGPLLPAGFTLAQLIAGWFGELAVGAAFGLSVNLLFLGVETFGEIIGLQAGITLAQVINPLMEGATSSSLGQLFSMVVLGVFLAADGHLVMLDAFLASYKIVPPLTALWDFQWVTLVFGLLQMAFELAVRLAAPAMLVLLLTKTAIGFIGRTAPQFNVLAIGLPLQILVGLFFAGSACLALDSLLVDEWQKWLSALNQMLIETRG